MGRVGGAQRFCCLRGCCPSRRRQAFGTVRRKDAEGRDEPAREDLARTQRGRRGGEAELLGRRGRRRDVPAVEEGDPRQEVPLVDENAEVGRDGDDGDEVDEAGEGLRLGGVGREQRRPRYAVHGPQHARELRFLRRRAAALVGGGLGRRRLFGRRRLCHLLCGRRLLQLPGGGGSSCRGGYSYSRSLRRHRDGRRRRRDGGLDGARGARDAADPLVAVFARARREAQLR
mmetsp:Transcript_17534/g.70430  ORF Transcript_17534/g.70430 Transcript_17534/m.70430 type:complete len:230 (+) Transcript_17534:2005-2694(+)